MTMRAELLRRQSGGAKDGYGHRAAADYDDLATVPCYAWVGAAKVAAPDLKIAVVEDRRMIVPLDTDVTTDDRVKRVTDRRGNVIFSGVSAVDTIIRRPDHLEIALREAA